MHDMDVASEVKPEVQSTPLTKRAGEDPENPAPVTESVASKLLGEETVATVGVTVPPPLCGEPSKPVNVMVPLYSPASATPLAPLKVKGMD